MLLPVAESYVLQLAGGKLFLVVGRFAVPFLFVAGMLAIGSFHAYLGDAYKRKHLFTYSALLLALLTVAVPFAGHLVAPLWWAVPVMQGILFGLGVTAGNTVAIDMTGSPCRTRANIAYAFASRLGMLTGLVAGIAFGEMEHEVMYAAAVTALLSAGCMSGVRVPFRSPIGMSVCNLDRFLLPSAWLPAVNVLLAAFALACFPPALPLLLLLIVPLTRLFVNLSHHCQRGTAISTLQLSLDTGVLAGLSVGALYFDVRICLLLGVAALSVLFFFLLTRPYYKRRRTR
ncbi:MAG: MFS transporter [Prevotellaceae bacterium]|jgi:MFS family permease|nr:MFS transporter [Prevotellaceae bacterium]